MGVPVSPMPVSAVAMTSVRVAVTSVRVAVTSVAVLAVGVAVVMWGAAFAAVGVSVAESADAHQVDQQASDRHRLQETIITAECSEKCNQKLIDGVLIDIIVFQASSLLPHAHQPSPVNTHAFTQKPSFPDTLLCWITK